MKRKMIMLMTFCFLLIGLVSLACAVDVNLQWDAVIHTDLAGYNVYQSEAVGNSSTAWAAIGTTVPGTHTFIVTALDAAKTYTWSVTAFSTRGEESWLSNPVSRIRMGPGSPQNLRQ